MEIQEEQRMKLLQEQKDKFLHDAEESFRQMGGGKGKYEKSGDIYTFHQHEELSKDNEVNIAFGCIKFDVQSSRTDAKYYVRVPKETPPRLLLHFVENVWELKRPNLLIGITGSADDNFKKSNELTFVLDELIDVARHTNAWLISGGTEAGIMKSIGRARYRRGGNMPLIGFSSWGVIHEREKMIIEERLKNYGHVLRKPIHHDNDASKPANDGPPKGTDPPKGADPPKVTVHLDRNHSHFVLVDDNKEKFGAEINLRGGFESCAISVSDTDKEALWLAEMLGTADGDKECKGWEGSKYKPFQNNDEKNEEFLAEKACGGNHAICLCFGGGPNTLGTIYSSVRNDTPVLLIQGTGKAADLVADCLRIYENNALFGDKNCEEKTSMLKDTSDVHNEWLKMRRVAMISRFLTLMREIKLCKELKNVGDKTMTPSDNNPPPVWWAPKNFKLLESAAGETWPWRRYVVGPVGQPKVIAAEETVKATSKIKAGEKRRQAYWVNYNYLIDHPVQTNPRQESGKEAPPDQAWIEEHKDREGAILHPGTDLHWNWAVWLGNKLIEEYEIKPPNSECVKMEPLCQLYESLTSGRCMTHNLWARQEVNGRFVQLDVLENMSLCIVRGMVQGAAAKKVKLCWEFWKLFHRRMREGEGTLKNDTTAETNVDIRKIALIKKCTEIDKEVHFRQVKLLIEWKQTALFQEIMKDDKIRSKALLNRCLQLALLHDSVKIARHVLLLGATTDAYLVKETEAPTTQTQNDIDKVINGPQSSKLLAAVQTASGVMECVWKELLDHASDEVEGRYLRDLMAEKRHKADGNGSPAVGGLKGVQSPTTIEEQAIDSLDRVYTQLASGVLDETSVKSADTKSLFHFTRDSMNHWAGDNKNLFFSLLVMNRAELANIFFLRDAEHNPSHMLSNSLWACVLSRELAEMHKSDNAYHAHFLHNSFENIALSYEEIAGDILKVAHGRSDKSALLSLEKKLHEFENWTCLDLILKGNCEKVIQKCPELCIRAVQNRFMGERGIQGAMDRMDEGIKGMFPFLRKIADRTSSFDMLGERNLHIITLIWEGSAGLIDRLSGGNGNSKFSGYLSKLAKVKEHSITAAKTIKPIFDGLISSILWILYGTISCISVVFSGGGDTANIAKTNNSSNQIQNVSGDKSKQNTAETEQDKIEEEQYLFYWHLLFCIGVDLISWSEYFIPVLPGFVLSYLWPLVAAYLVFCLHGNISLTLFALLEESLPVLNLFPTTTIGLLLITHKKDSDAEKDEVDVGHESEFVPFDHYIRDVFTHFIFAYLMTVLLLDRSSPLSYPLEILVMFLLLLDKLAAVIFAGIKNEAINSATLPKIFRTGLEVFLEDQGGKLAFASFVMFVVGFLFREFSYLVCYPLSFLFEVGDLLESSNVLYGLAVGLSWLQLLNFVRAQQDLGQFVRVMEVMAQDLGFFSLVWGILLLAFSSAMLGATMGPQKDHDFNAIGNNADEGDDPAMEGWSLWWFIRTYLQSLGQDYLDKMKTGASNVIFLVMWPIFNVLLVNLLVAVMGDRYDDAKEKSQISYCLDLDTLDRGFRFKGKTNLLSVAWALADYCSNRKMSTPTVQGGQDERTTASTERERSLPQEPTDQDADGAPPTSTEPARKADRMFVLAKKITTALIVLSIKIAASLWKRCNQAFIFETLKGVKHCLLGDKDRKFKDDLVDCEQDILNLLRLPKSNESSPSNVAVESEYYKKLKVEARAVVARRSRLQWQARKVKDHMVECAQEVLHTLQSQDI